MVFSKVEKDVYIDDFHRTFTSIDMTKIKIEESISAIYELIQTPIYSEAEKCFFLQAPFGIELEPSEHCVIPLGIQCDTKYFTIKSENPRYTIEKVTDVGDIFIHIHNISNETVVFEPDQVICKAGSYDI